MDRLRAAFVEALGLPPDVIDAFVTELRYGAIKEWDSVGHMRLVALLEEAFGVMLETDDVIDLSSYTRAVEILAKYGVDLAA